MGEARILDLWMCSSSNGLHCKMDEGVKTMEILHVVSFLKMYTSQKTVPGWVRDNEPAWWHRSIAVIHLG